MTTDELVSATSLVQARVQRCIAPSTESTYANTMARFERFCNIHLQNEAMSFELRLMIWCEYQMATENLSPVAAHQYCKTICAAIQK
ncbi:MAG: hypothetical protein Q7T55_20030, partial [Solirubrobacteraceae bacterium]|nr:hypothetical protein [Solirubrobacteraceae bacterium]